MRSRTMTDVAIENRKDTYNQLMDAIEAIPLERWKYHETNLTTWEAEFPAGADSCTVRIGEGISFERRLSGTLAYVEVRVLAVISHRLHELVSKLDAIREEQEEKIALKEVAEITRLIGTALVSK